MPESMKPNTSKSQLKVMTIVGTRPEIIRLSRVIALLDETVNHILVHTGQNYDYELNEIFFKELELRKPDYFLNADTSSLGATVGDIIKKSEEVLLKENPDALLVLGDTNSCLSAYMAKRMHIPIYHMEAGNRCFDFNVPEEINRRVIDHIADFNLVYTEHARRHLISEGLPQRKIYLTGSPMREVLDYYKEEIDKAKIIEKLELEANNYFIVSIHREENVDNKKNLDILLSTLNKIAYLYKKKVIISTHPRTKRRIEEYYSDNSSLKEKSSFISFLKPFGFFDYIKLQTNALCVISDSGTVVEESSILNFPAITPRNSIERPEGLDTGSLILTGINEEIIIDSLNFTIYNSKKREIKECSIDYKIENTSQRVINLILGLTKLNNRWNSIET